MAIGKAIDKVIGKVTNTINIDFIKGTCNFNIPIGTISSHKLAGCKNLDINCMDYHILVSFINHNFTIVSFVAGSIGHHFDRKNLIIMDTNVVLIVIENKAFSIGLYLC